MKYRIPGRSPGNPSFLDKTRPFFFKNGNTYSRTENMTAEAAKRRLKARFKSWRVRALQAQGVKVVTVKDKKMKEQRKRVKLKYTEAKEHRDVQRVCRESAMEVTRRFLEIVQNSDNESAVVAAGQALLDRGYGKASQTNINATVDANAKSADVSQKELDARIEAALERVEAIAGRETKAPARPQRPADVRLSDPDPDGSTVH
jgi:hypothetical protein